MQQAEKVIKSLKTALHKGVLENFANFTGKHLCQNLFFNKVAGLFYRIPPVAASVLVDSGVKVFRLMF